MPLGSAPWFIGTLFSWLKQGSFALYALLWDDKLVPHLPDLLKEYQKLPIDAVLDRLESSKTGLKHIEVIHRLAKYGPNIFWSKQSLDIKRLIKEGIF